MCIHGKFMSTLIVTVNFHYLPLFLASMFLSLALSVDGFFTLTFHCGGPHSRVELACALEWLGAIQVAEAPLKTLKIYKTLLIYNKLILCHPAAMLTPSIPN